MIMKFTLKELRARHNLTQEELARLAGLSPKTINYYEKDVNRLRGASFKNLEKLAEVLKVKVDDIYLGQTKED
jgi:DNA-binding XRE family transcriptional regulator